MTPLRRLALALTAAGLLAAPASALASGNAVIRDCTDNGRLGKTYSQKDYADALKNIPTDVDEYTDCRGVIRRAQLGAAGGGGGGSASGGGGAAGTTGGQPPAGGTSAAPGGGSAAEVLKAASPAERQAVEQARAKGASPIRIDGRIVDPGRLGFGNALKDTNTLPTSLAVVLVLLALGAAGGGGAYVNHRVLARRRTAAPQ